MDLVEQVRAQARMCAEAGSPLYGALLAQVADDVVAAGPAAAVLAGAAGARGPSAVGLRLAGAVHRIALTGRAPDLAAHYPSTGGDGDAEAAWPAFRAVLADHADEVRAGLARPPQTNEVGRCAALLPAVLLAHRRHPLPVRLVEFGTSAGLTLRADRYRYTGPGGGWGPQDSPVRLDPAWEQAPPWLADAPESLDVVERLGADPHTVDATSEDGATTLRSFVWPDQVHRLARLDGAIAVADAVPAQLVVASAGEVLAGLELADGTLTVVQHSVVWQYLDQAERDRVLRRLDELAAGATARRALAHVALEPLRTADGSHQHAVRLRTFPDGGEEVLGTAPAHGVPSRWEFRDGGPIGTVAA